MTSIIKRDGRMEKFNKQKIIEAVKKAFIAVDGTLTKAGVRRARKIGKDIEDIAIENSKILSVEEVQDLVENALMRTDRKDVASLPSSLSSSALIWISFRSDELSIKTIKLYSCDWIKPVSVSYSKTKK